MTHQKVADIMNTDVVSVRSDTPFHDVAELLARHAVSAVPVVDTDLRVIGVVSEADLLHKIEFADGFDGGMFSRAVHRIALAKAGARTASDLMTAPAVTVPGGTSVVTAAKIMEAEKVKRLPVVDDLGRLIGIASRGDLLKVFLRADDTIRDEIRRDVFLGVLWIDPASVMVDVRQGVVHLDGGVELKSLAELATRLVHGVDGVVDVVDNLTYTVDDSRPSDAQYYRPLV